MKLIVLLLLLVQGLVQQCEASLVTIRNPVEGAPTNLLVTDSGVLITVLDELIVLDAPTLSPLRTYSGYDNIRSSIAAIVAVEDEKLVVCLHSRTHQSRCILQADYLHCNQLESNCAIDEWDVAAFREAEGCLTRVSNYFYSASSRDHEIVFSYFQLTGSYIPDVFFSHKIITAESFNSREFFYNFFDSGYIYFIALDNLTAPEMSREIKLMRMCHINNISSDDFQSMFEIKLDCGIIFDNITIVNYFKINRMIFIGLSDGRRSKLCVFNLTDIDSKIMQAYQECYDTSNTFQLPWLNELSRCSGFDQVK